MRFGLTPNPRNWGIQLQQCGGGRKCELEAGKGVKGVNSTKHYFGNCANSHFRNGAIGKFNASKIHNALEGPPEVENDLQFSTLCLVRVLINFVEGLPGPARITTSVGPGPRWCPLKTRCAWFSKHFSCSVS
jgi:hypothetical protein